MEEETPETSEENVGAAADARSDVLQKSDDTRLEDMDISEDGEFGGGRRDARSSVAGFASDGRDASSI